MRSESVHHHDLSPMEGGRQEVLHVGLEDLLVGRAPSMAIDAPIAPSSVMEAINVVLGPRLRGTFP